MDETRKLGDLAGIGKAMLEDFRLLKIATVPQLAKANPDQLYDELCQLTGTRQDPCVLDVFRCAVAQARDSELPTDQRNWWFWSRLRRLADRKSGKL